MIWKTWKPHDKEWLANRLGIIHLNQVELLPDGWVVVHVKELKDDFYSLFRYGKVEGTEEWVFIPYGEFETRDEVKEAVEMETAVW